MKPSMLLEPYDIMRIEFPFLPQTSLLDVNFSSQFEYQASHNVSFSWQNAELRIEFLQTIEPLNQIEIFVQCNSTLSIPSTGIRAASQPKYQVSAALGPIQWTTFVPPQLVGAFKEAPMITFAPLIAEAVCTFTFNFSVLFPLDRNDTIHVYLPRWSPTQGVLVSSDTSRFHFQAEVGKLLIVLNSTIPEEELVTFSVQGYRIPVEGVPDSPLYDLKLDVVSRNGVILPSKFLNYPLIGYFRYSEILFDNPIAGHVSNIEINLLPGMPLEAHDTITVMLHKFLYSGNLSAWNCSIGFECTLEMMSLTSNVKDCYTITKNLSTIRNVGGVDKVVFVETNFTECPQTLVLKMLKLDVFPLQTLEWVNITLQDMNISLPTYGVLGDITVQSDAVSGVVLATELMRIQKVGAFLPGTKLLVDPVSAGAMVNLSLQFQASMPFHANDEVRLSLSGFRGDSGNFVIVSDFAKTGHYDGVNNILKFSMNGDIAPLSLVHFFIVTDMILHSPVEGIRIDQSDITISTDALDGPILPVVIDFVQPIGSFVLCQIDWKDEPRAGQLVAFTVKLMPRMRILVNEYIFLSLAQFGSDSLIVKEYQNFKWNPGSKLLSIKVVNPIINDELATINVSTHLGIKLPSNGIEINSSSILLWTNATEGPTSPTMVDVMQAIGNIKSSVRIHVEDLKHTVALNFTVISSFDLHPSDSLVIKLGGFLGHCQGDLLPHLSFDPSVFNLSSAVCNTSDSSVTLSLQVESDVPKGTSMSVTVSKSAGIELPAGGLTTSADFDRVTIRAEAKGALVLETPFLWTGGSIQRVGTLQQSSIRFDSTACSSADVSGISRSCIRAGSTVSVKVSFTASMPFRANESFTLCMPGFRGPENVSYVTLINSTVAIRNNRGLWDPTGCDGAASLSFEYLDGIAANVQSCVAISAGAGIRLPALG
eukprot:764274-Hanusia_phi.AAC.1